MSAVHGKAWAFTLDGHVFYVLNDVRDGATYICDLATGQWCRWFTGEGPGWNAIRGIMWRGMAIAADADGSAKLLRVDPTAGNDLGDVEIRRAVTGFQAIRGDDSYRQGSLRLNASVGFPTADPAEVRLRFSDDGGHTWVGPYTVTLDPARFGQVVEYRSLGRMRAPGRLWEITDEGGTVRIDGLDSTMERV